MWILVLSAALGRAQTVEGTVASAVSGSAIPGVKVDLVQGGDTYYSTTTDARGHFLLDHVQNGTYAIWYSSPDYFNRPEGSRQFTVIAGTPVRLEARMTPLARLSGRVVDGAGQPVPGAQVRVTGPRRAAAGYTDANGRFDLHDQLLPDAYVLSAAPPPGLKPPGSEPDTGRKLNWTRTYYPGVAAYEAASKIALLPGGQVSDVEIKLLAVPAHSIRGVLLNPDGSPVPNGGIVLDRDMELRGQSKPDGSFEFPAVTEGQWHFTAGIAAGSVELRASQWIEMAGRDIEGVRLRLATPFTLHGKVLIETPEGAPLTRMPAVALSPRLGRAFSEIIPDNGILAFVPPGSPDARAGADGNLTWRSVYPGAYSIHPMLGPPGYYLDSIHVGETEPSGREVEISSGAASITLTYKTNGGSVAGTAGKCASGGVLLLPVEPAMRRPGFSHTAPCDSNDRYRFAAVRPGDYYLLAFTGDSPEPWSRARIDDAALSQAVEVTVQAGQASSVDLRAIAPVP